MSKKEYLDESEVDKLIEEACKGDDIAFAQLIENFSDYIYHLCNKHIESSGVPASFAAGIMDDLYFLARTGRIGKAKAFFGTMARTRNLR